MIIGITTTYVEEEQKDEIVPVERVTVEYVRRVAAAWTAWCWPAAGTSTRRRTATKRAWPKP